MLYFAFLTKLTIMSKRQSSGQTNTLFNYFQSPKIKRQEKESNDDLNNSVSNLKSEDLNNSTVEDGEKNQSIFASLICMLRNLNR